MEDAEVDFKQVQRNNKATQRYGMLVFIPGTLTTAAQGDCQPPYTASVTPRLLIDLNVPL